jgi:hypothetical protein
MDLHTIADGVANSINGNVIVSVWRSTGSTPGTSANGYKPVPSYAAPVTGPAQVQAMDYSDLRQTEGLNLQGVIRAIYLRGILQGVIRAEGAGGDLVQFEGQDWLVVKILESWPTWTKACIVLQSVTTGFPNPPIIEDEGTF